MKDYSILLLLLFYTSQHSSNFFFLLHDCLTTKLCPLQFSLFVCLSVSVVDFTEAVSPFHKAQRVLLRHATFMHVHQLTTFWESHYSAIKQLFVLGLIFLSLLSFSLPSCFLDHLNYVILSFHNYFLFLVIYNLHTNLSQTVFSFLNHTRSLFVL